MLGMLIGGSFSIIDTAFIGIGMGKISLAAISLTWPLIILLAAFGEMIISGTAVLISQFRGANNESAALKSFGNMITLLAIASLVLCLPVILFLKPILSLCGATEQLMPDAYPYTLICIAGTPITFVMYAILEIIRNDGRPVLSMYFLILGFVSNIILDWLFIMFYHWGPPGAAYATVISQGLSALGGVIYFLSDKTKLKASWQTLRPATERVKHIFHTGIPAFGGMIAIVAILYMHNIQSLRYGGVDGLAAYAIIATVQSVCSMLMAGLANGIQPLVANMFGAKNFVKQNKFGNYGYYTAFTFGSILMIISIALMYDIPGWMGLEGDAASVAAKGVMLTSPGFALLGVIRVAAIYYQASGKIKYSSLLIYGDTFCILPICLFLLPITFGLNGVWVAFPLSRVLLLLVLCKLWFFQKGNIRDNRPQPQNMA